MPIDLLLEQVEIKGRWLTHLQLEIGPLDSVRYWVDHITCRTALFNKLKRLRPHVCLGAIVIVDIGDFRVPCVPPLPI